MSPATEKVLTEEYEAWLKQPEQQEIASFDGCAFDLLHQILPVDGTGAQCNWLNDFIGRWEQAEDDGLSWFPEEQERALREGWGLNEIPHMHVERKSAVFTDDAHALRYVKAIAAMNDPLAMKALHILEHWKDL